MLKQRTLTILIITPPVIAIIWFGEPWVTIAACLWAACAVFEFYKIVSCKVSPLTLFGVVMTLLFMLNSHFTNILPLPFLLSGTILISLILILIRKKKEDGFICWAWTIAGIFYIGWMLSYLVMLRDLENGREWLFLALLPNAGSDVAAYLIGKAIGKHKLAPSISPGKTWEGAVGGVLGAVIISVALVAILQPPISYLLAIILAVLVSIVGQIGGLVASLFKRNMGVKDSGKIFPGHGGFIDRTDSIIFATVAAYYFIVYLIMG